MNLDSFNSSVIIGPTGFIYLITRSPDPNNLKNYKDFLLSNRVSRIIKLCKEDKYDSEYLETNGINVIDYAIDDGTVPTKDDVKKWIDIVKKTKDEGKNGIACHCMSGLGRAPLFVCVTLIKMENMDPIDAITLVRKKIPRALNNNQLNYLQTLTSTNEIKGACIIC